MAHDNEPPPPREKELIQELRQLYHEEAQAVDRRLDRVWRRLERHPAMQQRHWEAMPQERFAPPSARRPPHTSRSSSRLPASRAWSVRVTALAAAVLLVVLVGGLTAGLILVRQGNTNVQATKSPTATTTRLPTSTPTISGNISFDSFDMMSATTGWATGFLEPSDLLGQTQILHTTDGGVHWKNVTPRSIALLAQSNKASLQPSTDVSYVRTEQFISGSVAWVLVRQTYELFETTDGGQTWRQRAPAGTLIRQFAFLDDLHGWVLTNVGADVVVFHTNDGGATWTKISSSGSGLPSLDRSWGMSFLNLTTGWTVFINQASSNTASLYITRDGGVTWQAQPVGVPAGVTQPAFPAPPEFFTPTDGLVHVSYPNSGSYSDVLYVTQNGGITWQSPILVRYFLESINFVDIQHGFALNGTGSALMATSDSGLHWAKVASSSNFIQIDFLQFVSRQDGWALKDNAAPNQTPTYVLLRTTDGGATWTQFDIQISN